VSGRRFGVACLGLPGVEEGSGLIRAGRVDFLTEPGILGCDIFSVAEQIPARPSKPGFFFGEILRASTLAIMTHRFGLLNKRGPAALENSRREDSPALCRYDSTPLAIETFYQVSAIRILNP
jgi:hypothetical protein